MAPGRLYVGSPTPIRQPFGLWSVAEVIRPGDPHFELGIEFEPETCGIPEVYGSQCPPDDESPAESPATGEKDFNRGVPLYRSDPFTVYATALCTPVGGFYERADARAREWLLNGRERAVEREMALGTVHLGQTLTSADTNDITPTPGTPVTVTQGIALLEEWISANGSGQGVILGSRRDVLIGASDHAVVHPAPGQQNLYTGLNTPVAALGGFDGRTGPTGAAPAGADEAWLYATGSGIQVREGETLTFPRNEVVDIGQNNMYAMAEQTFVVSWACGTAAILVSSV